MGGKNNRKKWRGMKETKHDLNVDVGPIQAYVCDCF